MVHFTVLQQPLVPPSGKHTGRIGLSIASVSKEALITIQAECRDLSLVPSAFYAPVVTTELRESGLRMYRHGGEWLYVQLADWMTAGLPSKVEQEAAWDVFWYLYRTKPEVNSAMAALFPAWHKLQEDVFGPPQVEE